MSTTGANLEEDIFNLVAHDHYVRVPHYRDLSLQAEQELLDRHLNRVTDTCIPEEEAMRRIECVLREEWQAAAEAGERLFPHEFLYRLIRKGKLEEHYQIDPADSWLVVAAACIEGAAEPSTVKSGIEAMMDLAEWYTQYAPQSPVGFFQIGGGIAGDFPICVVPMLHQDLQRDGVPLWSYFCQISDSITSYGSYSGAVPNERITWGKLSVDTPKHVIESDATLVAPLFLALVLGW